MSNTLIAKIISFTVFSRLLRCALLVLRRKVGAAWFGRLDFSLRCPVLGLQHVPSLEQHQTTPSQIWRRGVSTSQLSNALGEGWGVSFHCQWDCCLGEGQSVPQGNAGGTGTLQVEVLLSPSLLLAGDELECLALRQKVRTELSPAQSVNGVWYKQCQEQSSSEENAEVRLPLPPLPPPWMVAKLPGSE